MRRPAKKIAGIDTSAATVIIPPTSALLSPRSPTANSFQKVIAFCVHT